MDRMIEYFEYLDGLRASGVTNMFGAAPFLAREAGLDIKEARKVLSKWQKTYDPGKSADERAMASADT